MSLEPGARQRAGSQSAPQRLFTQVRPGAGGRVDGHEVGHQLDVARLGFRVIQQDALNAKNYFAASTLPFERNQFGATSAGRWCATSCSGSARSECLRQTHGRGELRLVAASQLGERRFLRSSRWPIRRSADRPAIPRQPHPAKPLLDICGAAARHDSPGEYDRGQQLSGGSRLRRGHRHGDDPARPENNFNASHSLFGRFIWYDSLQVIPGAFIDTGRPADRQEPRARAIPGCISKTIVNEISRSATTTAFHAGDTLFNGDNGQLPRNWVADLGLNPSTAA